MKYLYNYFGQKAMPFIRLITLISIILVIWKLPILLMKLTCIDNELKSWEIHDFELWGVGFIILLIFIIILLIFIIILLACTFLIYIAYKWIRYGKV